MLRSNALITWVYFLQDISDRSAVVSVYKMRKGLGMAFPTVRDGKDMVLAMVFPSVICVGSWTLGVCSIRGTQVNGPGAGCVSCTVRG